MANKNKGAAPKKTAAPKTAKVASADLDINPNLTEEGSGDEHVVTEEDLQNNPDLQGQVQVGETISIPKAKKTMAQVKGKYVASIDFRDINNYDTMYKAKSDVSHLGEARLKDLEARGIVKKA